MDNANQNILVTGFGPFDVHTINASWEAVKMLPNKINDLSIIKEEVPVIYSHVQDNIPKLWENFKPLLVVHVGVSSSADKITVEKCAYQKGYQRSDVSGLTHPTGEMCSVGQECVVTGIDVDKICAHLNQNNKIKACTSDNAGRYLCEFIFYISLNIDKNKTLFVHVPPLNKPYSAEELATGLLEIIKCALDQIQNTNENEFIEVKKCV